MKEVVGPGTKDVVGPSREQGHKNQEVLQEGRVCGTQV